MDHHPPTLNDKMISKPLQYILNPSSKLHKKFLHINIVEVDIEVGHGPHNDLPIQIEYQEGQHVGKSPIKQVKLLDQHHDVLRWQSGKLFQKTLNVQFQLFNHQLLMLMLLIGGRFHQNV
jgi:hypothetical protein